MEFVEVNQCISIGHGIGTSIYPCKMLTVSLSIADERNDIYSQPLGIIPHPSESNIYHLLDSSAVHDQL